MNAYLINENGCGFGPAVVFAENFTDALAVWKKWAGSDGEDYDPDSVEEICADRVLVTPKVLRKLQAHDKSRGPLYWIDSMDMGREGVADA